MGDYFKQETLNINFEQKTKSGNVQQRLLIDGNANNLGPAMTYDHRKDNDHVKSPHKFEPILSQKQGLEDN